MALLVYRRRKHGASPRVADVHAGKGTSSLVPNSAFMLHMKDLVPPASMQAVPPANGIYNALQLDAASTASGPSQAYSQLSRADGSAYSALGSSRDGGRPVSVVSSATPEYNALSDNRRSIAGASDYSALAPHASAGRPASVSLSSGGPEYSALNREGADGVGDNFYNALSPGGGGRQRPISTVSSATPEYNVLDAKSRSQAASTTGGTSLYSALDSDYVMPPFMGGVQSATTEYSLLNNSGGRQATSAGGATASEYSALDRNTQTSLRGQDGGATPPALQTQPEYNALQRATSTDAAASGYKRTLRRG